MSKKVLWCRNGALIGLALAVSDYFFGWRSISYSNWAGTNAIAMNVGQLVGTIGPIALIGLIAGAFADARDRASVKKE